MPRSLGILSLKSATQREVTIKYFQVGFILASTHQQQFPVEPAIRKQDIAVFGLWRGGEQDMCSRLASNFLCSQRMDALEF